MDWRVILALATIPSSVVAAYYFGRWMEKGETLARIEALRQYREILKDGNAKLAAEIERWVWARQRPESAGFFTGGDPL